MTSRSIDSPRQGGATLELLASRLRDPFANARILLADDVDQNRHLFYGLLVRLGYKNILLATDGLEVIDAMQAHDAEIDVLLLDIMMPGLDGYSTIRRLMDTCTVPVAVVVVSVLDSREDRELISKLGNDIVIVHSRVPKPVDVWELSQKVKHAFQAVTASRARFLPSMRSPRVLCAAAKDSLPLALGDFLSRLKAEDVFTVDNGGDLLRIIQSHPAFFDLLIVEQGLPGIGEPGEPDAMDLFSAPLELPIGMLVLGYSPSSALSIFGRVITNIIACDYLDDPNVSDTALRSILKSALQSVAYARLLNADKR